MQVTVITTEPENIFYGNAEVLYELIEMMIKAGVFVQTKKEIEERFAVIDDELVCAGLVNLGLDYGKARM